MQVKKIIKYQNIYVSYNIYFVILDEFYVKQWFFYGSYCVFYDLNLFQLLQLDSNSRNFLSITPLLNSNLW